MGSLRTDIKITNERNVQNFNAVIPWSYDVFGSETDNIFREAVTEDGYSLKRNLTEAIPLCDNTSVYISHQTQQ